MKIDKAIKLCEDLVSSNDELLTQEKLPDDEKDAIKLASDILKVWYPNGEYKKLNGSELILLNMKCFAVAKYIEPLIKDAREQERERIKGLRDTIYRIMQDNTELTEQLSKSVKWDREKVAKEICSLKGSSWCEPGCIDCGWLQGAYEVADQLYKELTGGKDD